MASRMGTVWKCEEDSEYRWRRDDGKAVESCLRSLSDANMAIANERASGRSWDLSLMAEQDAILQRFAGSIESKFDELTESRSKKSMS